MKRLFAAVALAAFLCASASAQVKITDLPAGTPATTDVVPFVAMSGTPATKKTTVADLFAAFGVTPSAVPGGNKNGNGSKFQLFSGSASANDCAKFDASGNLVSAGGPCAASGVTSLNGQTGETQTFSKSDDANVTLTITSGTNNHDFALGWAGTLAKARQHASTAYNDQANTFSAGAQDFGSASSLKVPTGAGAAPTASGLFAYDTTANAFKGGANGASKTFAFTDHTHTVSQVTDAGTAAALNVAAAGDAAAGEVVKGNDTRLTNSRTPSGGAGGVLSGSYPNPGFSVDMATQGELDAHASNTSNPHAVTNAQVGLGNVTNDAQLKISGNLSDLNNAATAPTNLGLGSAATASSSDFAATSHSHSAADVTSGTLVAARGGTGQSSYTDGQLLIGNSTGNTLTKATLTAGAGISITNGGGSITIAATAASDPDHVIATHLTTQSVPSNGDWNALVFNSEERDTAAEHSTSSDTDRLTAATAGRRTVICSVSFAASSTGYRFLRLKVNGTTALAPVNTMNTSTYVTRLTTAAHIYMNVGDYVKCEAFQDTGGALNATNDDGNPRFSMSK
jgi:hypothetical protein